MASKSIAEILSEIHNTRIEVVENTYRVKETPTHYVDVREMIFSWRVSRTAKNDMTTYDRNWCYYGTDFGTLLRAIAASVEWDGADNTEPAGWDKNANTGKYANPNKYQLK